MRVKFWRSASTGRFVTKLFAKSNPDTTVGETRRREPVPFVRPDTATSRNTEFVPEPQCQYCGAAVGWDAIECPACHAIFDEGENGVSA